ncbi:hypothetical protein PAAG_11139 [Paracoccidioides lutzii Pb01]|uniref:Uncharacterized protein n=1 Tax=Paracoccidioides lutzii (strain ATCC MYA-826 / Pb01) TaxID=502779 RepID=A0A0A2V409_PARBA|nr:hypothetical protein PAAG_11139 [Paracoccidioides lutzii Pb01]KGQ02183.1 hypothetical protein PAAG_11139 [Paracoccidioides lutzii Pb01]
MEDQQTPRLFEPNSWASQTRRTVTCSTTGAKLPISHEPFARESAEKHATAFSDCKPLPGVEKLLLNLSRARSASIGNRLSWLWHPAQRAIDTN